MRSSRFSVPITIALLVSAGCGAPETFDPATRYTAESLASELIFRYKALARGPTAPVRAPAVSKGLEKASKKNQEATKAAPSATLDDLIRDVSAKAALIPGKSRAEALRAVAEIVSKDATLDAEARRTLSDRLGKVASEP